MSNPRIMDWVNQHRHEVQRTSSVIENDRYADQETQRQSNKRQFVTEPIRGTYVSHGHQRRRDEQEHGSDPIMRWRLWMDATYRQRRRDEQERESDSVMGTYEEWEAQGRQRQRDVQEFDSNSIVGCADWQVQGRQRRRDEQTLDSDSTRGRYAGQEGQRLLRHRTEVSTGGRAVPGLWRQREYETKASNDRHLGPGIPGLSTPCSEAVNGDYKDSVVLSYHGYNTGIGGGSYDECDTLVCPMDDCAWRTRRSSGINDLFKHARIDHGLESFKCCTSECSQKDVYWDRMDLFEDHMETEHPLLNFDAVVEECLRCQLDTLASRGVAEPSKLVVTESQDAAQTTRVRGDSLNSTTLLSEKIETRSDTPSNRHGFRKKNILSKESSLSKQALDLTRGNFSNRKDDVLEGDRGEEHITSNGLGLAWSKPTEDAERLRVLRRKILGSILNSMMLKSVSSASFQSTNLGKRREADNETYEAKQTLCLRVSSTTLSSKIYPLFLNRVRCVSAELLTQVFLREVRDYISGFGPVDATTCAGSSATSNRKRPSEETSKSLRGKRGRSSGKTCRNSEESSEDKDQEGDEDGSRNSDDDLLPSSQGLQRIRFACPFNKFNPNLFGAMSPDKNYRLCHMVSTDNIAELKKHLQRNHLPPENLCSRCGMVFSSDDGLEDHSRLDPAWQLIDPPRYRERIRPKLAESLRIESRNPKGMNPDRYWFELYDGLFPGDRVCRYFTPWYESPQKVLQSAFIEFKNRHRHAAIAAVRRRLMEVNDDFSDEQVCNLLESLDQEADERYAEYLALDSMPWVGPKFVPIDTFRLLSYNETSGQACVATSQIVDQVPSLAESTRNSPGKDVVTNSPESRGSEDISQQDVNVEITNVEDDFLNVHDVSFDITLPNDFDFDTEFEKCFGDQDFSANSYDDLALPV